MAWFDNNKIIIASKIEKEIQDLSVVHDRNKMSAYFEAKKNGATHDEFMDALGYDHNYGGFKKKYSIGDYAWGRQYVNHRDLMDSYLKYDKSLSSYIWLRKSGANNEEALSVYGKRIPQGNYCNARESGATHNEILDAHKKTRNLDFYSNARRGGIATHDEALHAFSVRANGLYYGRLRDVGLGHTTAESLSQQPKCEKYLILRGVSTWPGYNTNKNGATHEEALEALKIPIIANDNQYYNSNPSMYSQARIAGADHKDLIDIAKNQPQNFNDYCKIRESNANDAEAKDIIKKGIDVNQYCEARPEIYDYDLQDIKKNIVTHDEAIDAAKNLKSVTLYAQMRLDGVKHQNAIVDSNTLEKNNINTQNYRTLKNFDVPHDEIMDAVHKNIDLGDYTNNRFSRYYWNTKNKSKDLTHQQTIEKLQTNNIISSSKFWYK